MYFIFVCRRCRDHDGTGSLSSQGSQHVVVPGGVFGATRKTAISEVVPGSSDHDEGGSSRSRGVRDKHAERVPEFPEFTKYVHVFMINPFCVCVFLFNKK